MPRDARLYMTFPNDYWMHPKVEMLSDAAFRAFVEMNGYSRMQNLDGRIPAANAVRRWGQASLDELVASHFDRPLIILEGSDYVIREYAKHQQTTEAQAELSRKRADAGRSGAAKRWHQDDKPIANAMTKDGNGMAEIEIEVEVSSNDDTLSRPKAAAKRGTRIPDQFIVTGEMRAWAATSVPFVDVDRETLKFVNHWRSASGRTATKLDWVRTWQNWLLNADERRPMAQGAKATRTEENMAVVARMAAQEAAEQRGITA